MAESICVRIKRRNQTFFIRTSKSSSISSIKNQISEALSCSSNDSVIPEKMRLYLSKDPSSPFLSDISNVSDHQGIRDNCELYLVFNEGGDVWESIDVQTIDD